MAVIARAEATLTVAVDVQKVATWYMLQASTSQPPAKPTAASPSGWSTSEPGYDGTSTNTLYTCQCTTLTDGTFHWGDVCVSSSYEAAKQAANDAAAAATAAGNAQADLDASRSWYATCSTAAGTAAKTATITPATDAFALRVGVAVDVMFSATNTVGAASLTLDVDGTGAKPIKNLYNGALSNLSAAGYLRAGCIVRFTYDGTNWVANLVVNSTYNLGQNLLYNTVKAKSTIASGSIIVGDASGYAQAAAGVSFDLGYQVLWCTAAISSGGINAGGNLFTSIENRELATRHGFSGGAPNAAVWLVGTVDGGTMTLAQTYLTTTVPASEDGMVYIPIGRLGNNTNGSNCFYFSSTERPTLYAFVDGAFQPVQQGAIMKATSLEQTAESFTFRLEAVDTAVGDIQSEIEDMATQSDLSNLENRVVSTDDPRMAWLSVGTYGSQPALTLGQSGSSFTSRLTNTKMVFMEGSNELVALSGADGLSAPKVAVSDELHVGEWMWVQRSNGHLTLKHIGG